ncbi:MAG: glycogen debranching protein GlgX [candidate division Zixibacteria bacterium]|nr:glycogen debranching protein GlgX [candidate division Zixibacteria bacterium]
MPDTRFIEKPNNLLDLVGKDFEITRGCPIPMGATLRRGGINFAVYSKHATSIALVLFVPGTEKPIAEFPLDPRFNKTGDIWHAFIIGLESDIEYGYRVDRQPNDAPNFHRFDPSQVLIDPYARALSGGEKWGEAHCGSQESDGSYKRRSLVVENDFDWGFDQPLNIPFSETIIYELHVRGYTRHSSSGIEHPGTYTGLIQKIPYLKELGITAVELLPINEFDEVENGRINPFTGKNFINFWGYNSINYFAPKASYAANSHLGGQINEFKSMVKAFHEAGIEVILDVVFNHTSEGNEKGNTHAFRGLDNSIYYLLNPETGDYLNYSGCGNTLNCNHPVVRDMILESLRYWVMEMHVDGFRFDLASILGRGQDGSVLTNPPLLERIAADPILGNTKLIAEPWDAAGLYQVGTFPAWTRWAEWNGKFRDDVRKFVKSDPGMTEALANRLMGSPDIFNCSDRAPYHSINFISCHDGLTLRDLVSFNDKHNESNGEGNRDGANDNNSWNCGFEGPTDSLMTTSYLDQTVAKIEALRTRQMKNLASILLLSRGVPMILSGDEFGRTQNGNNNAYCQDNEIGWVNWELAEKNNDLLRFFKLLIRFRKKHPSLRNDRFSAIPGETDYIVKWHDTGTRKPNWSFLSRCLAVQISEEVDVDVDSRCEIYIAFNAYWKPLKFELPVLFDNEKWFRKIDTSLESPDDIVDDGNETLLSNQESYRLESRSLIVLIGKHTEQ